MKRALISGLVAVVLAGCATPATWTKAGATGSAYEQDLRVAACMKSKGYEKRS